PLLLGAPVPPPLPPHAGWPAFFGAGPSPIPSAASDGGAPPAQAASDASFQQMDVVLQLLISGSLVHVGGEDSSLTYADLRAAAMPDLMTPRPDQTTLADAVQQPDSPLGIFVAEGQRAGIAVGHSISRLLWNYITNQQMAPDGGDEDVGLPLTEAFPATATRAGALHHLLVQAFQHAVLVLDQDAADASGHPAIAPLDVGVAYLRTLAPLPFLPGGNRPMWSLGEAPLLSAPAAPPVAQ